jgi:hypothetical protein
VPKHKKMRKTRTFVSRTPLLNIESQKERAPTRLKPTDRPSRPFELIPTKAPFGAGQSKGQSVRLSPRGRTDL